MYNHFFIYVWKKLKQKNIITTKILYSSFFSKERHISTSVSWFYIIKLLCVPLKESCMKVNIVVIRAGYKYVLFSFWHMVKLYFPNHLEMICYPHDLLWGRKQEGNEMWYFETKILKARHDLPHPNSSVLVISKYKSSWNRLFCQPTMGVSYEWEIGFYFSKPLWFCAC